MRQFSFRLLRFVTQKSDDLRGVTRYYPGLDLSKYPYINPLTQARRRKTSKT